MEAIKQTVKVQNRQVIINLPNGFDADEVEVIVLAKEYDNEDFELSDEQKVILDERLKEPEENYIPMKECLDDLKKKYGL
ncbi:MAG TPA: hypothetical protein VK010_00780 [Flavobacteriaceae bacterium]|nr:hypothetical protein [Flavobacteriaceae bacterium]